MLEIYQMEEPANAWDISNVAIPGKKAAAEARARAIYAGLMALPKPSSITSNNDWCKAAGLNTSFFTALQGSPKKPPSEPSIGNLRLALEAAGSSIPEFFAREAKGRLVPAPSRQALVEVFARVLPGLPKDPDKRAEYLAQALIDGLGLPEALPGVQASDGAEEVAARAADARARRSTK